MTKKKTAFISGASRGIGEAIARALAREDYHLALTCRNSEKELEALAKELRESCRVQVLTFVGDMGDPAFVAAAGKATLDAFQNVDVLINNAGISHVGLLTDMTAEQWNHLLSVNLSSCFYTAKAFVPAMVATKSGRIINISSMWGSRGASCEAAYSASKGGMDSLTKALAKELAPSNISVNAIACGVIDTAMNDCFTPEEKAALAEEIPFGRFASCQEAAQTVLALLSAPPYLTGQIIGLDGGI